MRKLLLFTFVLITGFLFGQEYEINTENAEVNFEYVSEDTKGSISGIKAKINLNLNDTLSTATISGEADVNTLSTGNSMRDNHLKSDEFFDAANFPSIKFTCSEMMFDDGDYYAKGTLEIKGEKKNVRFLVKPSDKQMVFYTTIYSADYGVSVKKDRKSSKVRVKVIVPMA